MLTSMMVIYFADMTTVTIEDPDEVTRKTIAENGQAYIGRKYAGKTVELVIRVVDDD